jgi:quercetin dioxygenase-like cupin family protein
MSQHPILHRPDAYPAPLVVGSEKITVLTGAAGEGYEMFVQIASTGDGPPPHQHPWDESLYVVSGAFELTAGEQTTIAGPGAFVHIPAGAAHGFRCLEDGSTVVSVTSGRSASGFFGDLDALAQKGAPAFEDIVAVAARHQVTPA